MIDLHTHLQMDVFDDLDEVLQRAKEAGLARLVVVGYDVESSARALDLACRISAGTLSAACACGIHPHEAKSADDHALARIEQLCEDPRVIAVGEAGLDFFRNLSPPDAQREAFDKQQALAKKIGKPLMIHCRDAYAQLRGLMLDPPPFVMHCFSSHKEDAKAFLDLGGYLSFAGPLTYPKNDALREAAAYCPLDRLFVETDCPYLPPQPKRGRRNEPAFIRHTVETLCEVKQVTPKELAEALARNYGALFSGAADSSPANR